MKKIKLGIILDVLLILINVYLKSYIALVLIIVILLLKLYKLKNSNLYNKLIKLDRANQLYSKKEDKLELAYGAFDGTYEEECQILKEQAKTRLEGSFYHDLSLCNNKTQIEMLIENYILIIRRNSLEFEGEIFLTFILEIGVKFFMNFLYIPKYFTVLNLVSLSVLLILELSQSCDLFNLFFDEDKIFLKFYFRLSFLRPVVSLRETLDELETTNSIYNTLYEDINENKISDYPKGDEKFINTLYKILINNKYNGEKELKEKYELLVNNPYKFINLFKDYYFVLVSLLLIYIILIA